MLRKNRARRPLYGPQKKVRRTLSLRRLKRKKDGNSREKLAHKGEFRLKTRKRDQFSRKPSSRKQINATPQKIWGPIPQKDDLRKFLKRHREWKTSI